MTTKEIMQRATSETIVRMPLGLQGEGIVGSFLSHRTTNDGGKEKRQGRDAARPSKLSKGEARPGTEFQLVTPWTTNRTTVKVFPPLTPALSSSPHPSTSSIASKFSTTHRHFSASPSDGKNMWSAPKSIFEAPACRLPRRLLSHTPCSIAASPSNCFANEAELGRPVRNRVEPQFCRGYRRASCMSRPTKTGSMHDARRDDSCRSAPPGCTRRMRELGWRSRMLARDETRDCLL